jgi:hypothetical protein
VDAATWAKFKALFPEGLPREITDSYIVQHYTAGMPIGQNTYINGVPQPPVKQDSLLLNSWKGEAVPDTTTHAQDLAFVWLDGNSGRDYGTQQTWLGVPLQNQDFGGYPCKIISKAPVNDFANCKPPRWENGTYIYQYDLVSGYALGPDFVYLFVEEEMESPYLQPIFGYGEPVTYRPGERW